MSTMVLAPKIFLLVVFFGILLLFPSQVLGASSGPPRIIRNVGQDAVFRWNMTNRIFRAKWGIQNNKEFILKAQFMFIDIFHFANPKLLNELKYRASRYKGRVDFVGDVRVGHLWFKLSNLTLNDTDRYAVKLEERYVGGVITYFTDLIVTAPPTFSPSIQRYHYIQEGVSMSIHCSAVGPPTPNVTWFHVANETMVAKSLGVGIAMLNIPEITRDQSGMYECQATNNPNESPTSTKTNIVVMYKPKILEHNFTRNVTSCNTSTILLYCMTNGIPLPRISWLAPDEHTITTGFKTVAGGSVLEVVTRGKEDDGQYRCRMENILGSDQHAFDVANEYINVSNCDSNSIEKEEFSTTEPKTCVPGIAVCVTIIVLLTILNVTQFVITKKKLKAKDENIEIEMDIKRKEQSKSSDKPIYENVSGMSRGGPSKTRELDDLQKQQQQDSRFHGDRQSPTLKTSKNDGIVNNQKATDAQIYTALGNRDPTPVYQKLSFRTEDKKKSRV